MTSVFPGGVDPIRTDILGTTSQAGVHAQHHDALAEAIIAVESTASLTPGASKIPLSDGSGHIAIGWIADGAVASAKLTNGAATGAKLGADVLVTALINAVNGVAGLDSAGKIPASLLQGSGLRRTFDSFCTGGSGKSAASPTLASQTAAWAAAQTWSDLVGGGVVEFEAGLYPHLPRLELHNHMSIIGAGMLAARLQFDSTITSGACVYNHVSTNGTTDPNAWAVRVQSLTLDCSQLPGWGSNAVNGITFNQNPQFSKATADSAEPLAPDTGHVLRDVYIYQPPQDGAVASAMGTQHWENVICYSAGRYGFQPPFDSTVINLTSGFSAKQGFLVTGLPVKMIGCKAFSSGNITHANGQGFHILPDAHGVGAQSGQSAITLVGCEAQDNWAAGFFVDGSLALVTLVGCIADSNSVRSAGTDPGFDILNSPKTQIVGCTANERNANGNNQTHAVSLRGTSTGGSVTLQQTATGGATAGTPFGAIDSGSGASFVNINNLRGYQPITFTSTVTPDFYAGANIEVTALTGPITIAAPTNGPYPPGTECRFILKQDATGGRTITWNGTYVNTPTTNTAANAYTTARFMWDGANWVGV